MTGDRPRLPHRDLPRADRWVDQPGNIDLLRYAVVFASGMAVGVALMVFALIIVQ